MKKINNWNSSIFPKSIWLSKLINLVVKRSKTERIENEIYKTILFFKLKKQNLLLLLFYGMEITKPLFKIIKSTKRGRILLIPSWLPLFKQYFYAIRWIAESIDKKKTNEFFTKFYIELVNLVFFKKSFALRKKRNLYINGVKNRALSRFRW